MTMARPLIAVVDDEPQMCKALSRLLKTHGFEVVTYTLGEEFLASLGSRVPDCVLLDLHMPKINGFEVLQRLAARRDQIPVIVITCHDTPENAQRVRALGCRDYLRKPLNESRLLEAIHKVTEQ